MAKVFISYAREDAQRARLIYDFLISKGHDVWFDEESLLGGSNWKLEISKAIRTSDFFIACLSESSVSKRGYFQKELKDSIDVFNEFPEGKIFVVPIRLEPCQIPEQFLGVHYIDWESHNGPDKLLKAISSDTNDQIESNFDHFLLEALYEFKHNTKILYPELLKSVQSYKHTAGPVQILNSTIRKIHDKLELFKTKNIFHYHITIPNLTVEIVNSISLKNIDIDRLRPLLKEIETKG